MDCEEAPLLLQWEERTQHKERGDREHGNWSLTHHSVMLSCSWGVRSDSKARFWVKSRKECHVLMAPCWWQLHLCSNLVVMLEFLYVTMTLVAVHSCDVITVWSDFSSHTHRHPVTPLLLLQPHKLITPGRLKLIYSLHPPLSFSLSAWVSVFSHLIASVYYFGCLFFPAGLLYEAAWLFEMVNNHLYSM